MLSIRLRHYGTNEIAEETEMEDTFSMREVYQTAQRFYEEYKVRTGNGQIYLSCVDAALAIRGREKELAGEGYEVSEMSAEEKLTAWEGLLEKRPELRKS